MNDEVKYTKLSALVDQEFKVLEVGEHIYKKWDDVEKLFLTSNEWQEGYRKMYPITTDQGKLDVGSGQLGNLLEPVFYRGKADLIGRTFHVKSNGKTGMDIRYYFNPVKVHVVPETEPLPMDDWSA